MARTPIECWALLMPNHVGHPEKGYWVYECFRSRAEARKIKRRATNRFFARVVKVVKLSGQA